MDAPEKLYAEMELTEAEAGEAQLEPLLRMKDIIQTVYPELRRVARVLIHGEKQGHTLVPTALVHEAVLQLLGLHRLRINDSRHFIVIAVNQMRRVLASYARRKLARKRFGHTIELSPDLSMQESVNIEHVVLLEQVLDRLAAVDPRAHQVVVLRFFAGLSEEEIGVTLGLSTMTVRRDWDFARLWLFGEIEEG